MLTFTTAGSCIGLDKTKLEAAASVVCDKCWTKSYTVTVQNEKLEFVQL